MTGRPSEYVFDEFHLYPGEQRLTRADETLSLPPKAFQLLVLLVRESGHLLDKERILKALWPDTFVEEANLANNVSLLRKTLGKKRDGGNYIETVSRRGYRFCAGVRQGGAAPAGEAPVPRLIVLPFRLLRPDEEISFLAHSLPDAIANSLSGTNGLLVRSSLLAARLASAPDIRQVAAEAHVDAVLTGTLLHAGEILRVSVQLAEAPDWTVRWAEEYQEPVQDLFRLHDSVVDGVVQSLTLILTEHEKAGLKSNLPATARAFEYYLRAHEVARDRTVENVRVALGLYKACLEDDPEYAPAWAQIGRYHRFLDKFGGEHVDYLALAERAFERAFALDPGLPIAHRFYIQIEADRGRAKEAMVRLLKRVSDRRTDPELYAGLVLACRFSGELEASVRAHEIAQSLDPNIETSVAHTWFLLGEYDRAIDSYRMGTGYYMDAAALACLGRSQEGLSLLKRRLKLNVPASCIESLMCSLIALLEGDRDDALRIIEPMIPIAEKQRDPETLLYMARHHSRAGGGARALDLVSRVIRRGLLCSASLLRDPWMESLRQTQGFAALLEECRAREREAHAAFVEAGGERLLGQRKSLTTT